MQLKKLIRINRRPLALRKASSPVLDWISSHQDLAIIKFTITSRDSVLFSGSHFWYDITTSRIKRRTSRILVTSYYITETRLIYVVGYNCSLSWNGPWDYDQGRTRLFRTLDPSGNFTELYPWHFQILRTFLKRKTIPRTKIFKKRHPQFR